MKNFFYAVCILQFCLIFLLALNQAFVHLEFIPLNSYVFQNSIILFLTLMTASTFYMMMVQMKRYRYAQERADTQDHTIHNIQEFNLKLRAQRHDFINHVQIVYSLMEMDEFEEAKKYLQKIYDDLETVNKVSRTGDVAFNAMLQAKSTTADRRHIPMHFEIASNLNGLPMPSLDTCRVMSNLIDNALYAAEQYRDKGTVHVIIKESVRHFIFQISNTGETIPEEHLDKIFQAGFTTKGKSGEGMGLYITKSIVEKYGGTLSVQSSGHLTEATLLIPKFSSSPKRLS